MANNENTWDKLLKIKTSGRDDSNADQYRYPYEPTPYSVLERLANSGYIQKRDVILDYGCGKGRVDFFLSYQTKAHSIGIEYDERIYQSAFENKKSAVSGGRCEGQKDTQAPGKYSAGNKKHLLSFTDFICLNLQKNSEESRMKLQKI